MPMVLFQNTFISDQKAPSGECLAIPGEAGGVGPDLAKLRPESGPQRVVRHGLNRINQENQKHHGWLINLQ